MHSELYKLFVNYAFGLIRIEEFFCYSSVFSLWSWKLGAADAIFQK